MFALDNPEELQSKVVNTAAGGTVAAIPAQAGLRIYVFAMELVLASSTTVEFKSGSTTLTGPQTMTVKVLDILHSGTGKDLARYECGVNEAFNLVFGSTVQCSGVIYYVYGA